MSNDTSLPQSYIDEPQDGAIEDHNLLALWELVRVACLAVEGCIEEPQQRHYVRAIRSVLAQEPHGGEDEVWEAMIEYHRFANTEGPGMERLDKLLSEQTP